MFLPGDGSFRLDPAPELAEISDEEIRRRMPALDSRSYEDLGRYLRVCRLLAIAMAHQELFGNAIVRGKLFLSTEERRRTIRDLARLHQAQARSKIYASSEVLLEHHGLKHEVPKTVHDYIRGKIFVDAGSFYGESSVIFLNYQPAFIHAFDPDPATQKQYQNTMAKYGFTSYRYHPVALGNQEHSASFHNVCRDRNAPVLSGRVTALDEILSSPQQCPLGLISADIEGMGVEMLEGAQQAIARDRPVLLLANYHNRKELFGMYEFIMELNLSYTCKMRALCGGVFEMTLIAYPTELEIRETP